MQISGYLIILTACFQLDPQALQDRDWQRTVIAMNGVCWRLLFPQDEGGTDSFQNNQKEAKPEIVSEVGHGWRRERHRKAGSLRAGKYPLVAGK